MTKARYKQTREWEVACLDTRRNLESRKKRLDRFRISPNSKVLDLGCADGLNTSILLERGVKKIIGIDISRDLIKLARKNNPQAKFYVGSAEALPFKANQFDVVLVDSVFHHLLKYDKPIKEIKRVLVKGGKLCFIEPDDSLPRRLMDFLCTYEISKYLPILNKRRKTYLEEKDLMNHWLRTQGQFLDILKEYGFVKLFLRKDFLSIIGKYKIREYT